MGNDDIALHTISPMKVAAIREMGPSPELAAWESVRSWAAARGLEKSLGGRLVAGFDNPPPAEDHPEYGYEFWIEVGDELAATDDTPVLNFAGGSYAVLRCEVQGEPWQTIPAAWDRLDRWVAANGYTYDGRQPFERYENPGASLQDLVLYMHYPVKLEEKMG